MSKPKETLDDVNYTVLVYEDVCLKISDGESPILFEFS